MVAQAPRRRYSGCISVPLDICVRDTFSDRFLAGLVRVQATVVCAGISGKRPGVFQYRTKEVVYGFASDCQF